MSRFRRSRKGGFHKAKFPLAVGIGVGGGLGISALNSWSTASSVGGGMANKGAVFLDQLGQRIYGYSPINGKWYTGNMLQFWVPTAGGVITHIVASKVGLNRILSKHLGFVL